MARDSSSPDTHAQDATSADGAVPGASRRDVEQHSSEASRRRDLRQRQHALVLHDEPWQHASTKADVQDGDDRAEWRESSGGGHRPSPHADAISNAGRVLPDQDGVQDGSDAASTRPQDGVQTRATGRNEHPHGGPVEDADRVALLRLVDLKYLSTAQLRDACFGGTDLSLVRRWMRRLQADGWVRLWTPPVARGRAPQYAIPTRRGVRWALAEKERRAAGTELEALARLTIPRRERAPVAMAGAGLPPFFAHQCGVNDAVIALERPGVEILWSTTWDRPLPNTIGSFAPPQPDGIVVVRRRDGALHLLFLEHDRATEKPAVFARTKRGYARLALTPSLVASTFGVSTFQVLVTVDAPDAARRIVELHTATRDARYPAGLVGFYDAAHLRARARPPSN